MSTSNPFAMPFSGGVWQDYHPWTNWFSPNIEVDLAGNKDIEDDVVTKVASYGKQLGLMMDVLVPLAAGAAPGSMPASFAEDLDRLKTMQADIEATKQSHRDAMRRSATDALATLKKDNPEYYVELIKMLYRDLP